MDGGLKTDRSQFLHLGAMMKSIGQACGEWRVLAGPIHLAHLCKGRGMINEGHLSSPLFPTALSLSSLPMLKPPLLLKFSLPIH